MNIEQALEPGKILRGRIIRGRKSETSNGIACTPGQIVVSVARPSILGNPFRVGYTNPTNADAVREYRHWLKRVLAIAIPIEPRVIKIRQRLEYLRREHLAGREIVLLCYCHADEPCHADVIRKYLERGEL